MSDFTLTTAPPAIFATGARISATAPDAKVLQDAMDLSEELTSWKHDALARALLVLHRFGQRRELDDALRVGRSGGASTSGH